MAFIPVVPNKKAMLSSILFFLLYLVIAIIVIELIFWILGLIIPSTVITPRLRGLLYALVFIILLIWALNKAGIVF